MAQVNKLSGQPLICQLFSYIPSEIITEAVEKHKSDYYYKKIYTKDQLLYLLYGVITKSPSLRSLCKNLLFLDNKLSYLGITHLPAVSTLSDANINRSSDVFAEIYRLLYDHYSSVLSDSYIKLFINNEIDPKAVRIFDATTISLFVDIFKAAGRNPINGKRKGGLKVQSCMPLSGFTPDILHIAPSASNDRNFLGQLPCDKGLIYVFDKGYMNYLVFDKWSEKGVYYVTRLQENAKYEIVSTYNAPIHECMNGGVIKDQVVLLQSNNMPAPHKARIITYKIPGTNRILKYLSNMFEVQATTIALLFKNRWNIEVLFKQLKQNFELGYFYSDSTEGIKTQIWIALIANLIFTVINIQCKESEQFSILVGMAATNLGSYVCFISLLKVKTLNADLRKINKIQLSLFQENNRGVFREKEKSP